MLDKYEVIVLGGGHAGSEAALAAARKGHKTLMIVGSKDRIGNMPCNPHIGGPSKGTIVREIDALGGEMAKNADRAMLQIKMLNSSKGPAVQCLRAQEDKIVYPKEMRKVVENQANLDVLEAIMTDVMIEDKTIKGIKVEGDIIILTDKLIIASGTYLDSRILSGDAYYRSGPDNERTTNYLSESLREAGLELIRLKTGTPPRIQKDSIDYSKVVPQYGDEGHIYKFSEDTPDSAVRPFKDQVLCYLTHTTEETHKIIREHLHEASMYSGIVKGVGPRYCPSIEDKVVRFSDKDHHQLFLEPESLAIDEIYISGFSSSLPHYVQDLMIPTLPGLEHAIIRKYAYAIEYDAVNPLELKPSLETKKIKGLYFAGQANGTSGYEEAACQGLMAGINASLALEGREPLILRRDEAYIGVLIDDLVTKGVRDPYRMLTSRAEFRLLLRHDNAEDRLIQHGHDIGLISDERYQRYLGKKEKQKALKEELQGIYISPKPSINQYLIEHNIDPLNKKETAFDLLKRPNMSFNDLEAISGVTFSENDSNKEQVLIDIRYEGYIKKEYRDAKRLQSAENRKINPNIDWDSIPNIAHEALEKLKKVKPETLGQASRISGVNPSDIAIISVWLEAHHGN